MDGRFALSRDYQCDLRARFAPYLPARFAPLTPETAAAAAWPATATSLGLGTSFIDVQRTSFEIRAIQGSDGPVGFLGLAHFHKREAAGAAGVTIRHQIDAINSSILFKHRTHR